MELIITRQGATQVSVTCDGQYSHTFDASAIPALKLSEQRYPSNPIPYGKALYEALFPADTFASRSLDSAPRRIVLTVENEDLHAISWEYLYAPTGFLGQMCHFVRALPGEQRVQPPVLDAGLHIVAVPSNPLSSRVAPLNIDAEWQRLTEIVKALPFALTLERTRPPTIKQLRATVAGQRQRVIHFMGHGAQNDQGAVLSFERDDGDLDLVQARDFALRVRDTTFLVTLNSCDSAASGDTAFSNLAAALARQKIPYALGMSFRMPDDDALLFSRAFYTDLASGSSVEEALLQARLTLARESPRPWVVGIPVLYTSLTVPATGFVRKEGKPVLLEHQPPCDVYALPRAEGTFQGRIGDLRRLGALLTGDNRPRILAIHGGGGQGKTALAREAVERFAYAWPDGVWGTTLENLPDRTRFAADLARFLGINPREIADSAELERQVLTRLRGQRILLVIDNAETLVEAVEADNPVAIQLGQFLQQLPSSSVSVLATSRVPLQWSGETPYDELGGLFPEEGGMLFEQCAPQRMKEVDQAAMRKMSREVSKKVEGHPLSLRLLGGAFNASTLSLSAFIDEYEAELMRARNKYRQLDHRHRSLYACIDTSVRYLNTEQRNLLSGLFIFHAPFLAKAAAVLFDSESEDSAETPSRIHSLLHQLWQRSLLTQKTITSSDDALHFYHLLPTTRPYVEHYLSSPYPPEELFSRFSNVYAHMIKGIYDELDYSASAVTMAQQGEVDFERAASYLPETERALYYTYWGRVLAVIATPQRSLTLLEEALKQAEERNDPNLTALILNNLALIYDAIGQREEASGLLKKALPMMHEAQNLAGEAMTLHNLAGMYAATGQLEQAVSLYKQALPLMRETDNRAGEAGILTNLAEVYRILGQWKQALELYEQSLPVMREVNDRRGEVTTLNNLAAVYRGLGQWERALNLYEQIVPILKEIGNRAEEALVLNNMAALYGENGQWERALSLFKQSLPITRAVNNRSLEALTLNNIARVYLALGQGERGLSLLEQALPIMREVDNLEGEAMVLLNQAEIYRDSGQWERALSLNEQALSMKRKVGDRMGEAMILNNIGMVYIGIGQGERALSLFEQALPIMRKLSSPAGEAMVLTNLAAIFYLHSNRTRDALAFMQQALNLLKKNNLAQDAGGQTQEDIQRLLQAMRENMPFIPESDPAPAKVEKGEGESETEKEQRFAYLITCTLAALGAMKDQSQEWREMLVRLRSQTTADLIPLFDALIGLLDAQGNPAGLGTSLTGAGARVWQQIRAQLATETEEG